MSKETVERNVIYFLLTLVVGMVGFFSTTQMTKLSEIERELVSVKLELTELKSSMLDEGKVHTIVEYELARHGLLK